MEDKIEKWRRVRLGDLIKVAHGWPFKSEFFTDVRLGRPIVVSIGNFNYSGGFRFESTAVKEYASSYPKDYELAPGDILLVMTCQTSGGEILGIPGRIPDDGNTYLHNQRMGKIVIKDPARVDPDFIYYLALWPFFNRELYVSGTGTKILHTSPGRIENFEFDLPSLPEQRAIGRTLRSLDDKIELNRRMNATLEAMARALFQSWFVDFDPVRAKLDGRQPPGLDPATAALFPNHFEHVPGSIIPKGWELSRWGDIATLEYGRSLRDYANSEGQYRVFGTNGPIGFTDKPLCPSAGIVIGRKGAYRGVHFSAEPFFVIDTAFYLKPKQPTDLKWAYYELLRFDINSMDSGSAIPSTSREDFYGIPVLVPPPELRDAFGQIVGGWSAMSISNNNQSRTLGTLRDTLLPKLLSGELSVAKAEELAGAAT
ncbi:MAG: restriction endonuclease subunit S [Bryobacteraceae bacterium]|nr:restriction endonuclease subunit S [Bryobacteraceae bacterium]